MTYATSALALILAAAVPAAAKDEPMRSVLACEGPDAKMEAAGALDAPQAPTGP